MTGLTFLNLIVIFLQIGERDGVDGSQINIFKPSLNPVLIIIEPHRSVG